MTRWAPQLGLILVSALVCAGGAWLERRPALQPLRDNLRSQAVPAPRLDTGVLGTLLQKADLVHQVANEFGIFTPGSRALDGDDPLLFRRKSQIGDRLYRARYEDDPAPPDSSLRPDSLASEDGTVISIACAPEDVHTLLQRHEERIEREAHFSVYREGGLVFSTLAGLKLHGGRSRDPGRKHSYRLHLRERYGQSAAPAGTLFDGAIDPVGTLIVRRVRLDRYNSCLSYDLARRLGCTVPETEPARLYLNGEPQGLYVLTERLSRKQLRSRIGHDEFLLFRRRGTWDDESFSAHDRLAQWVLDNSATMTASEVARFIDLDALSRYLLVIAFCGTIDWEQGAAVLETKDASARWYWIPWDLDRGFEPIRKTLDVESRPAFGVILDDPRQARDSVPALVLRALFANDDDFRQSFAALATESFNHALTTSFLLGAAARYHSLGASSGGRARTRRRTEFLRGRPRFVLEDLRQRLGLEPLVEARVIVAPRAATLQLEVDGHEHGSSYRGLYFEGQSLRVRVRSGPELRGWLVNGEHRPPGPLEVRLSGDTAIVALVR